MQKDICALNAVCSGGVLRFSMADARCARDKDHAHVRNASEFLGVVAGSAGQGHIAQ